MSITPTKTNLRKRRYGAAFLGVLALAACGKGNYDISNSTDRAAMKIDIKQALTNNDCTTAINLSTQLYQSMYSDNDARMLYASAQACNVGIQLYSLLDEITNADFGDPNKIIKTFVRLFPSLTTDSKMPSSWFAQDALQSILNPGSVIAPAAQISSTFNPGSADSNDRTLDANTYLVFISMAVIGTSLNRYGYSAAQSPAALAYAQGQSLPWLTTAAVKADTTGAACAIVSGFYNLFDGIGAIVTYLSGTTNSQLQLISALSSTLDLAGSTNCTGSFTGQQCTDAAKRIRYRGACAEGDPAAAFAAGVLNVIDGVWL